MPGGVRERVEWKLSDARGPAGRRSSTRSWIRSSSSSPSRPTFVTTAARLDRRWPPIPCWRTWTASPGGCTTPERTGTPTVAGPSSPAPGATIRTMCTTAGARRSRGSRDAPSGRRGGRVALAPVPDLAAQFHRGGACGIRGAGLLRPAARRTGAPVLRPGAGAPVPGVRRLPPAELHGREERNLSLAVQEPGPGPGIRSLRALGGASGQLVGVSARPAGPPALSSSPSEFPLSDQLLQLYTGPRPKDRPAGTPSGFLVDGTAQLLCQLAAELP